MIKEALRLIRVFHDISQTDMADRLGISKSYLSEIEGGKKVPTLDLLQKYSAEFDIPLSSILFFSESLEEPSLRIRSRKLVASKILKILQFVENKAGDYGGSN